MATSGSFTGARGGGGTGPYLTLAWSRIAVDTAGNRSQLRLTLNLVSDYAINFSASKTGSLEGNAFTYTGGMQGPQTKTLKTLDLWYNHDSAGNLTTTLDATFNINISWGGSTVSSISVSGSATVDSIARASQPTLSATTFNMGSTITINTNRADASFTHTIVYTFGSDTANIALGVGTSTTWVVPLSLANQVPSAVAGIGSITCHTYSGGTLIGTKTVGFTANVPSTIVPTATSLSKSIFGTGRDKTLSKYIQGISKVTASFSAAGAYGSTITGTTITVRRQSDLADSQVIGGTSGTTANPVALSGTYYIVGEAYDSRGRYAAVSTTITVDAYSPPSISTFTASRGNPTTTVSNVIAASWSLGASNPTDVTVVGVNNVGTSVTLYSLVDNTAGTLSTTRTYTSQSDASSYTYTITLTDSFGNVSSATIKLGTSFVEMTIAKGQGVGIGKVWEQGALDVGGLIYAKALYSQNNKTEMINDYQNGNVTLSATGAHLYLGYKNTTLNRLSADLYDSGATKQIITSSGDIIRGTAGQAATDLNTAYTAGRYSWDPTTVGRPYDGYGVCEVIINSGSTWNGSSNWMWQVAYTTNVPSRKFMRNRVNGGAWNPWVSETPDSGGNGNGNYTKFHDGLMICYGGVISLPAGTGTQAKLQTFPLGFSTTPVVTATLDGYAGHFADWYIYGKATNGFTIYWNSAYDLSPNNFQWIAIGRWN